MFIENKEVTIEGKFIKIAIIRYSWAEEIDNPLSVIKKFKDLKGKADIFAFWQKIHQKALKYNFYMEWDNFAVLPVINYEYWFKKQIPKQSRMKVKKAKREGVEVNIVNFSDELVQEIENIYNETPFRQGKPYARYKENVTSIKKDLAAHLDCSDFLGAYYHDELIGYVKLLYKDKYARTVDIISKIEHRDKAPNNALLAKAVEICEKKQIPFLIYGSLVYGKRGSPSLEDFKRYNGFEKIDVPKYYIPLTTKGQIILKLKLHHGIVELLPRKVITQLRNLRNKWYQLISCCK